MKTVSIINMAGVLAIAVFLFLNKTSEKRIVYVNNNVLLTGFKMSAELNSNVKNIEQSRQMVLDSILNELKLLKNANNLADAEKLKSTYLAKRNMFTEELTKVKQSMSDKIAAQINQYVKDFSEEKKYDIVLGANGSGNIWYSTENNDITKDLVAYVNKKYDDRKN